MNKEIPELLHISDGSYSVFKSENTKIGPFFPLTLQWRMNKNEINLI